VESDIEREGIELGVAWCQVAKNNIAGYFDILNVRWPAIGHSLTFGRPEFAIWLIAVGDDQAIGAVVRSDPEGLGSPDEGWGVVDVARLENPD
jgi:hypothetical protein